MIVKDVSLDIPKIIKKQDIKIGTVIWVKGVVARIDPDGYTHFEVDSPISGCIFNGGVGNDVNPYGNTEIKIENN